MVQWLGGTVRTRKFLFFLGGTSGIVGGTSRITNTLITLELCLNYAWIMLELCLNHVWITFESRLNHVWITFESRLNSLQKPVITNHNHHPCSYRICIGFGIPLTCIGFIFCCVGDMIVKNCYQKKVKMHAQSSANFWNNSSCLESRDKQRNNSAISWSAIQMDVVAIGCMTCRVACITEPELKESHRGV